MSSQRGGGAALGASLGSGLVQRARTGVDSGKPGPQPGQRPKEEDACANYEKDRESMAWSIARHTYRSLGRPWPGIDTLTCKDGPDFCPISCDLVMNDGLHVSICYDPAKNTASSGLLEVKDGIRRFVALCELTYSCPQPSEVVFNGKCEEMGKKGG